MEVIALDRGFGNTKASVGGNTVVLQTALSRPRLIGHAAEGMKSASADVPIVSFGNGQRFAVGYGSWYSGEPVSSLDYSSLASPEMLATMYVAVAAAINPRTKIDSALMIVGLPCPLMKNSLQFEATVESLKKVKGQHDFEISGEQYSLNIERIKVVAQPVGAYTNWLFGDDLKLRNGSSKVEAAVIDWGMNTLDLYGVIGDQVMDTYVGGAEVGVHKLLERMSEDDDTGLSLAELDAKLRDGDIAPTPEQMEYWMALLRGALKPVMPNLKRFGVVIPTGGGALVAGDSLKSFLRERGANVYWPANPVIENVLGLAQVGLKELQPEWAGA